MHLSTKKFFAACVLLLSTFFSVAVATEVDESDRGVVKVGNIVLTQMDVDIRVQKLVPMQLSFHGGMSAEKVSQVREEALEALINRTYKVLYAVNEEISVDSASFDQEWEKILNRNKGLSEEDQAILWGKVRSNLYLDMLAQRAEEVVVDNMVMVSDEDVSNYYVENKKMYFRPKLFTASHILVRVDPASNVEERELRRVHAEDLLSRAKAGEDFYNLAYYESDDRSKYVGGSLGSFHAGQTVHEFDEVVQKMKVGEVAGPVRTLYGFHIIKLDALDDERQLIFDEVARKIRTQLEKTERKQLYEAWITQLKEQYPVESLDK